MAEYKRIALLIGVMMVVVIATTAVGIGLLYQTAFERERLHLIANVGSHARLMESMARFESTSNASALQDILSAALSQIVDAYAHQPPTDDATELTIGRLDGKNILFLMRHHHRADTGRPAPVPLASGLAEAMARALAGESGSLVGLDYHGERVLAAYEPVAGLGLGIVAKVDLAEIRAPFLRAGAATVGVAFLLIAAGTLIFIRVTNPMIATLRQREAQLGLLLASTGEGIFGMDTEGRCTFANRSALEQLGYDDPTALLGRDMHELIHHTQPDGQPHHRDDCPILAAMRANTSVHVDEETLWRADGTSFPAEYRAQPMRRNGEVVGTVATFVDITERKARELQLLQAQKMEVLGRLTGGIAHDFNNLLTIILGNLRFMAGYDRLRKDKDLAELAADAVSAAEDGAELTARLLAFARKQTLRPELLDVNDFARESAGFIGRVTGERVKVRLDLEPGGLPVLVDRSQLHGALLNLAINARDAMPEGGTMTIGTRRKADRPGAGGSAEARRVVLSVRDDGSGMSPEVAERATEPFFTTKARGQGSGLGLSMVYGFARQSGGDVTIRSVVGEGTEVAIRLPEAEESSAGLPGPARTQSRPVRGEGTVLVVEDEQRLRAFVVRCLAGLGYTALAAADAREARKLLLDRDGTVDLLFTDIVMPGDMDGADLARWAVARWPRLRVLLTTGFSAASRSRDADGRFPLLAKPFAEDELASAVANILHAPRPARPAGRLETSGVA